MTTQFRGKIIEAKIQNREPEKWEKWDSAAALWPKNLKFGERRWEEIYVSLVKKDPSQLVCDYDGSCLSTQKSKKANEIENRLNGRSETVDCAINCLWGHFIFDWETVQLSENFIKWNIPVHSILYFNSKIRIIGTWKVRKVRFRCCTVTKKAKIWWALVGRNLR